MAEREMFVSTNLSQNLACGLQKCLAKTWQADDPFSDFEVIVDGTSFRCHKYILNATSGYFHALFGREEKELTMHHLEVNMVPKDVFKVIARALYTGVSGLTKDNFQDVWQAAQLLQIQHLCDECEGFALQQVKDDNCVEIFYFAQRMNSIKVANSAKTFMIFGFEAMIQSEGFLRLMTHDVFAFLLGQQYLNVSNEDVVVDSILRWVYYEEESSVCTHESTKIGAAHDTNELPDKRHASRQEPAQQTSGWEIGLKNYGKKTCLQTHRAEHLPKLLGSARLLLTSVQCLERLITLNVADISPQCRDIMREAVMFSSLQDNNLCAWKTSATHRFSSKLEHAVVIMTEDELNVYRMEYPHNVRRVAWVPRRIGTSFENMVVFKNKIYVEGMTTLFDSLLTLDEEKNWRDVLVYRTHSEYGVDTNQPNRLLVHNRSLYRFRSGVLFRLMDGLAATSDPACVEVFRSENIEAANEVVSFDNFLLFFTHTRRDAIVYGLDTGTMVCRRMSNLIGGAWCLISFRDGNSTYLLQSCGTLLRVVNNGDNPVSFQFVTHLWDCEWFPMLAVRYLDKLVIFGKDMLVPLEINKVRRSVPGLMDSIEVVKLDEGFQCYPMTVPRCWFTDHDSII